MTKEFWINLPVKDIKRTKDFFTQLGFTFKPLPGNREDAACLILGSKSVQVMFFEEHEFRSFTNSDIPDTSRNNEVLFSVDAENAEEINMLASKVSKAGGKIFAEPGEKDGWMYGFGFTDPDGHKWNVLHMDESKMQQQHQNQEQGQEQEHPQDHEQVQEQEQQQQQTRQELQVP
ncbi:MAG TPA: VOC family protein [Bacteroidales bacterium]|nr:VOC family protein [Bacteroidales bacterium]